MSDKEKHNTQIITPGTILKGPMWPEPICVMRVAKRSTFLNIDAYGKNTERTYRGIVLRDVDLQDLEIISTKEALNFEAEAKKFWMALEAKRIRLAYEYDPHFAVSVSRIEPLPHQLEAVYHCMLKQPRVRFLLADDPGAGKTIMAGLLLKELKYRGLVERTLIVTPALLQGQWQKELKTRFQESFDKIDRGVLKSAYGRNIWLEKNQCITSIDFAKQEEVMETLREANWDLVIVDEAHKMSAYRYGQKEKKSDRYQLGELLSKLTHNFLMLTATPHKGDPENFRLLLKLLDPDLFSNTNLLSEAVNRRENPLFIRRMKEDMRRFDGTPLFPPRTPKTILYELSPAERHLYEEVSKYVSEHFQRALAEDNRNVGLALTVLQRRLASSTRAIRMSLMRRKKNLEALRQEGLEYAYLKREEITAERQEEIEDMEEAERWSFEEEILQRFTNARTLAELDIEIKVLGDLVELARSVEQQGIETKLTKLQEVLRNEGIASSGEKLLIFTEAKDTLDYLSEKLKNWGFSVEVIHGKMSIEEREAAQERFYETSQIMVATEAAGEGINLQFCSLMVNYDLPWNPNRLEQRMGRIHRIGQTKEVFIYNLVAIDTKEGQVMYTLLEKLERMREHLGTDRVFDVISEILPSDTSLENLIKDCIANRRTLEEVCAQIGTEPTEDDIKRFSRATLESLATRYVDLPAIQEEENESKAQRLMPEYIENFFIQSFESFGGKVERRRDGNLRIERVPIDLRRDRDFSFQRKFGKVEKSYPNFTFHKEKIDETGRVELMGPGHPLFESLLEKTLQEYSSALSRGALFLDPEKDSPGLIWFLEAGVRDGTGRVINRKLFALRQKPDGSFERTGAFILHDIKPVEGIQPIPEILAKLIQNKEKAEDYALEHLLPSIFEKAKQQRQQELEIKERYLRRSFNYLIAESQGKLIEYEQKASQGRDMALAIDNEQRKLEDLQRRFDLRLKEVVHERQLTQIMPEVIAVAGVLPMTTDDPLIRETMYRDDEIESIAMKIVLQYEMENGREPEDVSRDNLGFDIISKNEKELRFIEVKGRAAFGGIALTPNEWIKAKRLKGDYWLYIVIDARTSPKLYIIQNPAERLKTREEIKVVRILVNAEDWKRVAESVQA